jgi:hypothetical protein
MENFVCAHTTLRHAMGLPEKLTTITKNWQAMHRAELFRVFQRAGPLVSDNSPLFFVNKLTDFSAIFL